MAEPDDVAGGYIDGRPKGYHSLIGFGAQAKDRSWDKAVIAGKVAEWGQFRLSVESYDKIVWRTAGQFDNFMDWMFQPGSGGY
jgi:hypothetical protein